MDLHFGDELKQLQEEVRRLLTERVSANLLRRLISEDEGYDPALWRTAAELGLLGAAVPEQYGGSGLGERAVCAIAEEMGRAVAPLPFFSSICLAAEAIKLAGAPAQKSAWLPRLASGEAIGTFAWQEGLGPPETDVDARFENGRISGVKSPVPDALLADVAVVVCEGPRLALADLSKGVRREPLRGFDQLRSHAKLVFENTPAEAMDVPDPKDALRRLYDRAAIYAAFEQLGAAESAMFMARDYTLQRYTFGRQLASYQAVKHNLANILVMVELARSNALYAAAALEADAPDLGAAAATARLAATRAYETAARENLQLHGGVGFTWEADCHFHYRRARLLALSLGSPAIWENRLIEALTKKNAAAA
ncbi:MAG: acyl-CoA/acyl-ACP dehydrogenase [Caulobacteraceae bacterium]|nr:acyl-CoA/acyl-ACP dehydrogenase [Caulobacteraceae bacterium]